MLNLKGGKIRPINRGVTRAVLFSIAILIVAIGVATTLFGYLLTNYDLSSTIFGIIMVWAGSLILFYAFITEEHTMKELFLRENYFFTGVLAMIIGVSFTFVGGLFVNQTANAMSAVEFGLLLLIFGGGLMLLSARRAEFRDYTRNNALMAFFAGLLLLIGGIVARSANIIYLGVAIIMLSAVWLGLRSKKAL